MSIYIGLHEGTFDMPLHFDDITYMYVCVHARVCVYIYIYICMFLFNKIKKPVLNLILFYCYSNFLLHIKKTLKINWILLSESILIYCTFV